jgi:hypothetical protein
MHPKAGLDGAGCGVLGCQGYSAAPDGFMAALPFVTREFHIEDRARGRVVATGVIDANDRVTWDETEASVSGELADLANEIQQHIADGHSGGQLRPPLEWFEL